MPNTTKYAHDFNATFVEPEEKAYNANMNTTQRRFRAICPDGIVRSGFCGIPDTFFSIPAKVTVKGKTVYGFISKAGIDKVIDGTLVPEDAYLFTPNAKGKNANIFEKVIL